MQALLIEQVDWSRLQHAYGWATDTPEYLKALAFEVPEAIEAAIEHLWSAIIHQGTPWTATAPVTKVILAYLKQPNCPLSVETQWHLVRFLLEVAELAWHTNHYLTDYQSMATFDLEPFLSDDVEDLYANEEAAMFAMHFLYAFLKALVDKTEFWDERFGNPNAWFQIAGLTYNRKACQQGLMAFESLN